MRDNQTTGIIPFKRRTYEAKQQEVRASGLTFEMAGTLDGWLDVAITESNGSHRTYQITKDDARSIIAALHAVVDDIAENCLFERDPLLMPDVR